MWPSHKQNYARVAAVIFFFWFTPLTLFIYAEDYVSSNFILRDPFITIEGGYSSSTNFQYFSSSGQLNTAETSGASFIHRGGFLYFPTATSPILSATAGNGQVSFTWTASVGTLANITTYELGTATVSGGPYTFESSGNVLSFTKSGLTNGATYYFIVRAFAGTLRLANSGEVSATPTAPPPSPSGGGGGGGGGGYVAPVTTSVVFSGRAYPKSTVTLLKDAQIAATTIAGADANFSISVSGISGGNYIFAVYSEDKKGIRSSLLTFPVSVTSGVTTNIGGIFIAPTIAVDKSEVKRGENIAIFGQSAPNSEITIVVNSDEDFFNKTNSDKDGVYLYNFDTSPLDIEQHFTKSKAAYKGEISSFSKSISFLVGARTVPAFPEKCGKADLNCDSRVNLVDFSIAAYWYKRPISAEFAIKEKERLNGDGKIDLVDFSIMAFYWTG